MKKFLIIFKRHHWYSLFLFTVGIFFDICFLKFTSSLFILFLVFLWIWTVIDWQLEGKFSIFGGLILLIVSPFLLILKKDPIAEKVAAWVYVFLATGVIQQLIELKMGKKLE